MTTNFFADLPSEEKKTEDFFADLPDEKVTTDFFVDLPPEEEPTGFFERFGKAAAMQAKMVPPAAVLPQAGLGFLEEISLGAIDLMPAKTEAGKFARGVGKYAVARPLILEGLATVLSPFGWLGRIIGIGAAGSYQEGVKQYFKKGEINLKDVGKEGAIWASFQAGGELASAALQTKQAVDFISKSTGKSKPEVARYLADVFKKRFKQRFKINPNEKNIGLFSKQKPNEVAKVWEESIKDVKAAEVKPTIIEPAIIKPTEVAKVPPIRPPGPPELPPPQKPSGEEPASPEKINEGTSKYFSNLAAKLDVEAPFKKVGANETGFAVKNYYDQINKYIGQGKEVVKQIKKLKLTDEQLNNVVLQSELAKPPKDPKERQAWIMMRSYYDKSLERSKKYGVLKKGFHERIAADLLAQIKAIDDLMKISRGKNKIRLEKQAKDLLTQLKEIAKLRFVSIPVRELFESKMKVDPALFRRAVKFLTKRRRKTLSFQDLIDSGLINKKDLTPELVIGDYSRKHGRDIALAKIINAAKKEGLATLEEKPGMVKVPGYVAPELAKYWINPVFADFIQGYTNPKTFSNWEKMTNRTKGWAIYNPFVLASNNLWQQAWAVLGQPRHLLKLPGAWAQAIKDVKNKTPNYWEALDNGLRSSPFVALEKNLKEFEVSVEKEGPNPLLNMIKKILKYPMKGHEKIYDLMQAIAWTGGDMVPRMATYNWLRSIGLNARDAAQTAAMYHGDYASVPPDTRRKLNKFMFTPTFKIVTGKAITQNLSSSGKIAKIVYQKAKGEKGAKVDPKTKAKGAGLIGGTIILGGLHLTMKSLGWETVFPLWHYKKDYIDEEGKKQTQHIHFSFPFTTIWKFIGRGYKAATERGVENRLLKFVKSMKFEFAIPIQTVWELMENKNRHWKNIYDPRAPFHEQLYDMVSYVAKRVIPLVGIPLGERFRDPEDREKIRKEMGRLTDFLPFMFPYITDPQDLKDLRKARRLMGKLKWLIRQEKITESEKENYMKEIDKLLKKK
jgi:hypothetical protein